MSTENIKITGLVELNEKKEKIIEHKTVPFQVDFKEFGKYNDKISIILRKILYKKLFDMFSNFKLEKTVITEVVSLIINRLSKIINKDTVDIKVFLHSICNESISFILNNNIYEESMKDINTYSTEIILRILFYNFSELINIPEYIELLFQNATLYCWWYICHPNWN